MRIVLWIGDGANQKALAHKIHSKFPIDTIIIESKQSNSKITFSKIFFKLVDKLLFSSIDVAWFNMIGFYHNKFASFPSTKLFYTENINSDEVYNNTLNSQPDLIIVSGTRMIKEKLLSLEPKIGILNLHTGLSPYIKGGPNCTNWCIATNQFHLIGNTIMWIDKGIDSGNIVTTELTEFNGDETLKDVHIKVMEHAQHLYVEAIAKIGQGKRSNVAQKEIGKGKTYYTKDWNAKQKWNLIRNFKKFNSVINSNSFKIMRSKITTIKF